MCAREIFLKKTYVPYAKQQGVFVATVMTINSKPVTDFLGDNEFLAIITEKNPQQIGVFSCNFYALQKFLIIRLRIIKSFIQVW